MRIWLVIKGIDLDVSGAPIQDNGLSQGLTGLKPNDSGSRFAGESLQLTKKPPPQAEPPRIGVNNVITGRPY
jgi:hypothetical protein